MSDETLVLLTEPYADLVVTAVAPIGPASSGKPLTVTWSVANQGIGITRVGSWTDRVYLSRDQVRSADDVVLGDFSRTGYLRPGETYTRQVSANLPQAISGTYYLIVATDSGNGVNEALFESNNERASAAFTVDPFTVPGPGGLDDRRPGLAPLGRDVRRGWTVRNQGTAAAAGSWRDNVWLSRDNRIGGGDDILLRSFTQSGPLAAGGTYSRREVLTLPEDISGTFQIIVQTDALNTVFELNGEDNNVKADDQLLEVTLSPRADLQVAAIHVPETAGGLTTIGIEWEVVNRGTAEPNAPFWTDRVYLSLDNVLDVSDRLVGSVGNPSTLRPGESYLRSLGGILIPRDLAGDAYIIVVTDAGNAVREYPLDGNNTGNARFEVIPIPPADLILPEVSATRETFSGQQITVQWMVQNQGPGVTDPDQWIDYVYLALAPHGTDTFLGSFPHQGKLARDEGYVQVQNVRIPDRISGQYYITVVTDALNNVPEFTFETPGTPQNKDGNNRGTTTSTTQVFLKPPPDLEVTSGTVTPTTALGGDTITVSWAAANHGSEATDISTWTDSVYLRTNTGHGDVFLGSVTHHGALNVGASYGQSGSFRLPDYEGGDFLVIKVDANNSLFEGPFESNNILVIPIQGHAADPTAAPAPAPQVRPADRRRRTCRSRGSPASRWACRGR